MTDRGAAVGPVRRFVLRRLVQPVARRLRRWTDDVLEDGHGQALQPSPAARDATDGPANSSAGGSVTGPAGGPPAHWLEHIRRRRPELLPGLLGESAEGLPVHLPDTSGAQMPEAGMPGARPASPGLTARDAHGPPRREESVWHESSQATHARSPSTGRPSFPPTVSRDPARTTRAEERHPPGPDQSNRSAWALRWPRRRRSESPQPDFESSLPEREALASSFDPLPDQEAVAVPKSSAAYPNRAKEHTVATPPAFTPPLSKSTSPEAQDWTSEVKNRATADPTPLDGPARKALLPTQEQQGGPSPPRPEALKRDPWASLRTAEPSGFSDSPSPVFGRGGRGVRDSDSPSPVLGRGGRGVRASGAREDRGVRASASPSPVLGRGGWGVRVLGREGRGVRAAPPHPFPDLLDDLPDPVRSTVSLWPDHHQRLDAEQRGLDAHLGREPWNG